MTDAQYRKKGCISFLTTLSPQTGSNVTPTTALSINVRWRSLSGVEFGGGENEVVLFLFGFGFCPPSLSRHLLEDCRTTLQALHKCSARENYKRHRRFILYKWSIWWGEGHFLPFCNKIHFLIQAFYVSFPTQSKCCEHVQRQRSLMWNSPQILNQGGIQWAQTQPN